MSSLAFPLEHPSANRHNCPQVWIVQQGHDLCEEIELAIINALPSTSVTTHLKPLEDPTSWHDLDLERISN